MPDHASQETTGGGQPPRKIVNYTVVLTLLSSLVFIGLIGLSGFMSTSSVQNDPARTTMIFITTVAIMFVSGTLGGCLYNFRGLIKHSTDNDFSESYNLSYYVRPIAGSISGAIVFFLLLGGTLTFNPTPNQSGDLQGWATNLGRMPYIAIALLAGYGSQELMLKLKDLSESFFALSKRGERK